jgi:hypothetical protein
VYTPLEDGLITENIIYKMLYCYASADIKLNASSIWLCVFRQPYYKKTWTILSLEEKTFENKFFKTASSALNFQHFPPYLFGHVDNMISTFGVVVLLNRPRTMAFTQFWSLSCSWRFRQPQMCYLLPNFYKIALYWKDSCLYNVNKTLRVKFRFFSTNCKKKTNKILLFGSKLCLL